MNIQFTDQQGTFQLEQPDNINYLYFPLTNEGRIMESITPTLSGDSKTGQNTFLLEPASSEDLHDTTMGRNVWCKINEDIVWSVAGISAAQKAAKFTNREDKTLLQAGKLWHKIQRSNAEYGISSQILNFCPATDEQVEIMKVTIKNISENNMEIVPTVAIPIYGRSADNLRDHRHVTSLLHRIEIKEEGVVVTPTLSFDERGHKTNKVSYGVFARGEGNEKPVGFYPVMEDFIGDGATLDWPRAIVSSDISLSKAGEKYEGYEAMGGIQFAKTVLSPSEEKTYCIVLSYNEEGMKYLDEKEIEAAFEDMQQYWTAQSTVSLTTKDEDFNNWMEWVGIQPALRRIYGCSFLPHHDYGRGGRGWRDLWQDSLALLLMNAENVRDSLVSYYQGVRIDGSNATIIGAKPGEFIADRNSIVRVWMDHGFWPWLTTNLYINQTGDIDILFEEGSYFKDGISHRGIKKDELWNGTDNQLKTIENQIYKGTILEHILVQNLTIFYDVGEHNQMKLRGADWNDALDMARENGESVAFTAAYGKNLDNLVKLFNWMRTEKNIDEIMVNEELEMLIWQSETIYNSVSKKQDILEEYCTACQSNVSGNKVALKLTDLEKNLMEKEKWLQRNIRNKEWIETKEGYGWYNGYYDDNKHPVEGEFADGVRMMLTSQVFTIMSGVATDEQVVDICKTADHYLLDEKVGGYRLNTNFHEMKKDLGRMFGFAYGHKENGAVFSHMAVMYSYSLYSRGFVKEGYKVIKNLYKQVMNFDVSHIYPGIPEYFSDKGKGMYHYLTGAASWLVYTTLTEMFGVKGEKGDLTLTPKLMAEQFDNEGMAKVTCQFAGCNLLVIYENKDHKETGDYQIEEIFIDNKVYSFVREEPTIERKVLLELSKDAEHTIQIILS